MEKSKRREIDRNVGQRLRIARTLRGLTQAELAKELDVSFQQVQKYEKGGNRVSAGMLYDMAQILEVPLMFFFSDGDDVDMVGDARSACFTFFTPTKIFVSL